MPRSRRPQRRRKSSSARSAGNISQIPPAGLRGPVRIGGRRTRRWLFLAAAGVLAIAIIISFFLPQILDLAPDLGRGTDEYKGGVGEEQDLMTVREDTLIGPGRVLAAGSEDARHDLLEWPEYSTSPPTSGPHLSFTWPCGFYDVDYIDPVTEQVGVPDRRIVHNMEHGHVVMKLQPARSGRCRSPSAGASWSVRPRPVADHPPLRQDCGRHGRHDGVGCAGCIRRSE